MRHLKKTICTFLFFVIALQSYSQADSTELNEDDKDTTTQVVQLNVIMPRKRGVYKTYEEYLNNSPSVEAEFTVKPLQISRNNPLIAEGDVDYKGKRPKKI